MKKNIVTISRQYGSGGRYIGEQLAKELGVPCYDDKLIDMVAKESGFASEYIEEKSERITGSLLFNIASSLTYASNVLSGSGTSLQDEIYFIQSRIIKELAEKGPCVIVGRCADFVLKDNENVIRLFVHSTPEKNLETVCNLKGLEEKEAQKLIDKTNKHRAAYYKCYTGREWDNAKNYDLCLDSSRLTYEKCVEIVKAYINIR